MSATFTLRHNGDVLVIDVAGRISLHDGGASSLRDAIRDAAVRGERKVLLNMAETSYVDSCGIGEMVSGFTMLCNQGAQLKLLALTKRVKDLLKVTKLYAVFDVYDIEEAAIRGFS
jgi:anti-sigma B factor antagonist